MFSQGTMTPMSTTFQVKMVESKLSWPWTSASYALLSPNGRMTQTWRTTAVDFGILPYEYFWTLEVAGLVVVASQHNTHNVLANIVHITLHCGLTNDHPPTLTGNLKGAEAGKSLALFHQLSTNKHQPMDNMNQPTESRQFYHQPMDFFSHKKIVDSWYISIRPWRSLWNNELRFQTINTMPLYLGWLGSSPALRA